MYICIYIYKHKVKWMVNHSPMYIPSSVQLRIWERLSYICLFSKFFVNSLKIFFKQTKI